MRLAALLLCLTACRPQEPPPDPHDSAPPRDSDTDTDTDADTDTDTDADTDADADADSDPPCGWSWGADNGPDLACASFLGEAPGDQAGAALFTPGDMDGDGIGDLVLGAPYNSEVATHSGKVYLLFGRQHGWALDASLAGEPSVVGHGQDALALGTALGDVNGDGLGDLSLHPGCGTMPLGDNYVVLGKTSGWAPSQPIDDVEGSASDAQGQGFTGTVAEDRVGDVDGDGLDDWLLTGPAENGQALLVLGPHIRPGLVLPDEADGWVYGGDEQVTFSPTGDVDGDGRQDLMAFTRDSYRAFLIMGTAAGLPQDARAADVATCTLAAPAGEHFEIGHVGDVNGDGRDELSLTVRYPEGSPDLGLYLFFGREVWPTSLTPADADVVIARGNAAYPSWPIGDVDGDGLDDLLFSLSTDDGRDVVTDNHLLLGRGETWPETIAAGEADARFSWTHGTFTPGGPEQPDHVGDFNGDGLNDLLFLAWSADRDGTSAVGMVSIFVGRASWDAEYDAEAGDVRFVGAATNESFGTPGWTRLADLNGDGCDDLVLSSAVTPSDGRGETFLFFGRTGP